MSRIVGPTGVYSKPKSLSTLLLLMWEFGASLPSGSAAAAGQVAFKVSVMNLADMLVGWLTMYLQATAHHSMAQHSAVRHCLSGVCPASAVSSTWLIRRSPLRMLSAASK